MDDYKIPNWCKDAVLTDAGVANKYTSELYISKKGVGTLSYKKLNRDISVLRGAGNFGQLPNCLKNTDTPVVEEVEPIVEAVVEEVEPIVEAVVEEVEPIEPIVEKVEVVKPKTTRKPTKRKVPTKK